MSTSESAPRETNRQLALNLKKNLELTEPVVALAFTDEPPEGVARPDHPVPAACTFWREGRGNVFFADAEQHRECPIGMLTMGFGLPKADESAAMQLVQTMCDLKYFTMAEVDALPKVPTPRRGILYGPLEDFPVEPAVVLVVVNSFAGMLVAEASGSTDLANSAGQSAFGRPACSAIPRALAEGKTVLSLGCIGARTYVGLRPEEGITVIPGAVLQQFVDRLDEIARANAALASYHAERRRAFGLDARSPAAG